MRTAKEIGNAGEDAVARYLEKTGYRILRRNYISNHGEIDIIAENGRYLVFCEVKTRKNVAKDSRYGRPSRAVDAEKKKHLLETAERYMKEVYGRSRPDDLQPRMDVAEVLYTEQGEELTFSIRYLARAFGR